MTMIQFFSFIFILLLSVANSLFSVEDKDIEVVVNPHGDQQQACALYRLDGLLEPYHLITTPLTTQQDTFRDLIYRKMFSVPIPIYRMKQPERLSAAQLEFQLVLVKDLGASGKDLVYEVPVNHNLSVDSWFPGYSWTPVFMECNAEGKHVGWKYTATQDNMVIPFFYALMVNVVDDEGTSNGIFVGGFKAVGWIANKVIT